MAWKPTAETIAALAVDQIKNLRKNAEDREMPDVVALCKPVKVKKEKVPKAPKEPKAPKAAKAEKVEKVEEAEG